MVSLQDDVLVDNREVADKHDRLLLVGVASLGALATGFLIAALGFAPEKSFWHEGGATAVACIMALIAAAACVRAAVRSRGKVRSAFGVLVSVNLLAAIAWGLMSHFQMFPPKKPYPIADIFIVACKAVLITAFLVLRNWERKRGTAWRVVLDGVIVSCTLFGFAWVFVLRAMVDSPMPVSTLMNRIVISCVAADILGVTIVLLLAGRARKGVALPRESIYLLTGGTILLALANFVSIHNMMVIEPNVFVPVLYTAGHVLFAVGALLVTKTSTKEGDSQPNKFGIYLPNASIAALIALAGFDTYYRRQTDSMYLMLASVAVVGTLVRQFILVRENAALNHKLEIRVEARTAELRASEEKFRSVVQNSSDVTAIINEGAVVSWISPAVTAVFGYEPGELEGHSIFATLAEDQQDFLRSIIDAMLQRPGDSLTIEWELRHADGYGCSAETIVTNLLADEHVNGLVLNTRDITDRKNLAHQASHDSLTGLPNRRFFELQLDRVIGEQMQIPFAVLYCDLDGFKAVNDSLGHRFGDELLNVVSERLKASIRPGDLVARLGGDEFGILLESVSHPDQFTAIAERVTAAISTPFQIASLDVNVGVSVGIAVGTIGYTSPADIIRDADLAMYKAKTAGGSRFESAPFSEQIFLNALD